MQRSPADLVERFYHDLWNRANEAVAWEILHPDFRFRASLGPEKIGPGGFIEYMRLIHTALSGYRCTIQEMLESGERVAALESTVPCSSAYRPPAERSWGRGRTSFT